MRFISVRDLRGKSAEIWRKLSQEKLIVVTSNGRPIAVLSPVSEENLEESVATLRRAQAMAAVEAMQTQSVREGRSRISSEEIDEEISAVRKHRK